MACTYADISGHIPEHWSKYSLLWVLQISWWYHVNAVIMLLFL
jgi:hypothetical protein